MNPLHEEENLIAEENATENENLKKVHLQVLDLTPYEYSEDTINLLMEGLTFAPTPPSNE